MNETQRYVARLRLLAKRLSCVLHGGHFTTRQHEPNRIALKCIACGHTTPGWEVGGLKVRRAA